ncbi:peroxin 20 [Trichoderma arundinaceum]|uniref:Peroxin 20 n=1 Tax=Trichoderma arundinaceum TaxID=490622 RepID=A0A395NW57_TRIAR|nr:peroxin 20 [Trichoderma arundinaceum]
MEDASCSGSTPFKRLVDHQSRDLSHHQDRHVSRGAFGQSSFRSSPLHPAQGQQDGFGAFMGSASALPGFESDPASRLTPSLPFAQVAPAQPVAHPGFSSPMQMGAPASSNWAADFNRFSAQQRSPAPTTLTPSRQMSHSPAQTSYQPSFTQPNFASAFGTSMFSPPTGAAMEQQPDFNQEMSRWMSAHGGGNMQEVDAAMEQMARELEESEAVAAAVEASRLTAEETEEIAAAIKASTMTDLEAPEIGNLSLDSRELEDPMMHGMDHMIEPQPEQEPELEKEPTDTQNPKSAVAEAAEKLLDCVKHESGEKWQNSIFLSLMRDFRDGRKDIVGDEIRSTGETAPAAQPVAT